MTSRPIETTDLLVVVVREARWPAGLLRTTVSAEIQGGLSFAYVAEVEVSNGLTSIVPQLCVDNVDGVFVTCLLVIVNDCHSGAATT